MPIAKVSRLSSVLSALPDGMNYYYGYAYPDPRQINVRFEGADGWVAYVGGIQVSCKNGSLPEAEQTALDFIVCNPLERSEW